MSPREKHCECCSDGFGWIWNMETQSAENCPVCNPGRDESLVDAHLKRGEALAVQSGNSWLRDLSRQKRNQNRSIHTNTSTVEPRPRNRPPHLRGAR